MHDDTSWMMCLVGLLILTGMAWTRAIPKKQFPQRTPQSDNYFGVVGAIIGALLVLALMLASGGR